MTNDELEQKANTAWVNHVKGESHSVPLWAEYTNVCPGEVFEALFKEAWKRGVAARFDQSDGKLPEVKHMNDVARSLSREFLGKAFILLVAEFNNKTVDNASYISNCSRESSIAILKTVLFRWGINDEWMKKAV